MRQVVRAATGTVFLMLLSLSISSCSSGGGNSVSAAATSSTLLVTPAATTVSPGGSVTLQVSGGTSPYAYSMQSGLGTVTAAGIYTASDSTGTDVVLVRDSAGNTGTCTITISTSSGAVTLSLLPQDSNLAINSSLTFTTTGGTSPYTYAVTS